jgi:hypothetical protein
MHGFSAAGRQRAGCQDGGSGWSEASCWLMRDAVLIERIVNIPDEESYGHE